MKEWPRWRDGSGRTRAGRRDCQQLTTKSISPTIIHELPNTFGQSRTAEHARLIAPRLAYFALPFPCRAAFRKFTSGIIPA